MEKNEALEKSESCSNESAKSESICIYERKCVCLRMPKCHRYYANVSALLNGAAKVANGRKCGSGAYCIHMHILHLNVYMCEYVRFGVYLFCLCQHQGTNVQF